MSKYSITAALLGHPGVLVAMIHENLWRSDLTKLLIKRIHRKISISMSDGTKSKDCSILCGKGCIGSVKCLYSIPVLIVSWLYIIKGVFNTCDFREIQWNQHLLIYDFRTISIRFSSGFKRLSSWRACEGREVTPGNPRSFSCVTQTWYFLIQ